jgi:hypothetical protein
MFKKTPSSIDDYRAEFDRAQAEIFASDTESAPAGSAAYFAC